LILPRVNPSINSTQYHEVGQRLFARSDDLVWLRAA
jgi:hypothetical protein